MKDKYRKKAIDLLKKLRVDSDETVIQYVAATLEIEFEEGGLAEMKKIKKLFTTK